MAHDLAGKVALITGSTDGIGIDTAKLFAEEGAQVIVSGRNSDRGRQVVDEITSAIGQARFIQADLADLNSLRRLADEAGDVDILVNNAAIAFAHQTFEQDVESFEECFTINVRAPYFLTAAIAPQMVARKSGSIVNVSTMAANVAIPGMSVYSASKAALNSLTRTWAAEFADSGVRVNTVAAGPTATRRAMTEMDPGLREQISNTTLLRRLATTREIAETVLFLASDRSSYMTGATLAVDAGRTAV